MPSRATQIRHFSATFCLSILLVGLTGCLMGNRPYWHPPTVVLPAEPADTQENTAEGAAERSYAMAFQLEDEGDAGCVDHYFQATTWAWTSIEPSLATASPPPARAWSLYHSALTKLLVTAQRFGRWRPGQGLLVTGPAGPATIPSSYHGFTWVPADFNDLHPVGDYRSPYLNRSFRASGLGVPIVAVHRNHPARPFTQAKQSFPATVVLRPFRSTRSSQGPARLPDSFASSHAQRQNCRFHLEFYDPLRQRAISLADSPVAIAYDLTASFAYASRKNDEVWLRNFLQPGTTNNGNGLFLLEPYQRGKIPLIFVHGLLSDPKTWADMANELRGQQEIVNRYQLMAFRYATGDPFFGSAAKLRQQLQKFHETYDPQRTDPALSRVVMVGHSMGGLIAKLQITYSGDRLWQAVANTPLNQIKTSYLARDRLTNSFFFDPNPDIRRVVFIGTPHRGSRWARRPLGRLGSMLVRPGAEQQQLHAQLLQDNPGVFSQEASRRFPTSIDLLEPSSPLLNATLTLPYRPGIILHTIAGDTHTKLRDGPTDGVVPLSSARLRGVTSEKIVAASHTRLNHDSATVAEIIRILHEHLRLPEHGPCVTAQPCKRTDLAANPEAMLAR